MIGDQSATSVFQLGPTGTIITIRLRVHVRVPADHADDPDSLASVSSGLPYEPKLFADDWSKQDFIHRQLHDGIRDGLSLVGGPIPDGGIHVDVRELNIRPHLQSNMSDEDIDELGWRLNRLVAGMAFGLSANVERRQ